MIYKRNMKFSKVLFIRYTEEDHDALSLVAAKLGLTSAEITRRSIRIGLPILRDLDLPGSPQGQKPQSPEAA